MRTKQFMMAALTMACAIAMTTVFSACGDDDDITPQYAMYSHSDHTQGISISDGTTWQTVDYYLALYNLKVMFNQGEPTYEEKLAAWINSAVLEVEKLINNSGGTPVNNLGERDREVIKWYDKYLTQIQTDAYKTTIKGKFEVYRSVNGKKMETIKTYTFPK